MNELTLVVMAAGMGSRFGGLKQITPVDEEGNFLIDYSIYDAIKAGFKKVVFIIKKENLKDFEETVGKRIKDKIKVEYAFQDLNDVPKGIVVPESRIKPWGTTHAILSAKNCINGPFAVINADDFYGYDSYRIVAEYLNSSSDETEAISVPYPFSKVDSKYGFVKRGVLYYEEDRVKKIVECNVGYDGDKVLAKPLSGATPFEIEKNHPVSMNMFGFHRNELERMTIYYENFMIKNKDNLDEVECLIPDFIQNEMDEKKLTLKYRVSNGVWLGMTYKEDLEMVKEKIKKLKENGEYPVNLWN